MKESVNVDTQKSIFINIINSEDLTKFKRKCIYFENEVVNDMFNTIVQLYVKSNKIILDSNIIVTELNDKYTVEQVNLILKHDINEIDKKWLDDTTKKYLTKTLLYQNVKEMVEICQSDDPQKIKQLSERLNINIENSEEIKEETTDISKTPLLTTEIYNNLPTLLQKITSHFDNREKDVVLMSSLSVVSILFNNSFMRWKTDKDRPNLFLYIGGRASSGKSKMKYSRMLLNTFLRDENETNKLIKFQSEQVTDKKIYEKPILKNILIPGNSSSAAFEEKLNNNEGKGLIFTEESSEIGMNKKQDWGNYDNMLRKAFHNETISSNRKDCDIVYIENSYISTSISGTFDQLMNMFEDKDQNGLFSRFIFYLFDSESKWIKDNGLRFTYNKENDLEGVFNGYSDTVFNIYNYYKDKEIEVDLTEKQCEYFDNEFERLDNQYFSIYGEKIKPSINRMGVICRKIMIILSLIRNYEENNIKSELFDMVVSDKIMVNQIDLKNSIMICEILMKHTSLVFNSFFYNDLGKKEIVMKMDNKEKLFDLMNTEFSFVQMKEVGLKEFEIQPKTIQRYLRDLVNRNIISHIQKGYYKKN